MLLAILFLLTSGGHAAPAPAPEITWADFFASVSTRGLVYSDTLRSLEGRRVRLRGFAITTPAVPGGVLLSKDPYSDPHDVDETDVPYDAVGVHWRVGLSIPRIPSRPTVEGILRLGNHDLGSQTVAILLDDAVPASPDAGAGKNGGSKRSAPRVAEPNRAAPTSQSSRS